MTRLPKAYWEGMDAWLDGDGPEVNPYPPNSKAWVWWRRGWIGAC